MNIIDSLVLTLGLDSTGLKQGAKEATAATAKLTADMVQAAEKGERAQAGAINNIVIAYINFAREQKKATDSAVKNTNTLSSSTEKLAQSGEKAIRTFGALFLAFTGARSIKDFASDMLGADAALGRTARSIGQTPEALSGIGRAVERMGGSFDGAVGGLKGLSDAFQQLRTTGTSGIMEPLARLQGLSGKRITFGADVKANFYSIADALHAMKDQTQADFLGRQILGDEGLVNFAKGGSGAARSAEAASPKVTEEQTEAAQRLQSQLVAVRQGFQDIGNAILIDFGPAIVKAAGWVKDLLDKYRPLIKTKVAEWVQDVGRWFNAHQADVANFGKAVGDLATVAGTIATAFASQSPMMQALELFAVTMGGTVLRAVTGLTSSLGALSALSLPSWLSSLLLNPAILGTAAVGAVLAQGDPDKIPLIGKHPDVQPQDSDLGLPGVGDRRSDTSDAQGKIDQAGGWWDKLKKAIGWGDRLHDDPKTKDNIEDTAKSTKGILDLMKETATNALSAITGVTSSSGGLGGSGQHVGGGSSPGASPSDRAQRGRHGFGGTAPKPASGPAGVPYAAQKATVAMGIMQAEWDAFREGVTDIEGKRYDRMGGAGGRYAGRYQMGPAEITETAARLGVPRPTNAQFLADPAMQERFFENYTLDHYRTLMGNARFAAMSPRERLKILGYAHNQGTGSPRRGGGAWSYLNSGAVGHDAFGTAGTAYLGTIGRRLAAIHEGGPTAQAPVPAGTSEKAVTDAEVFAARQRIINGSRDPKDRALVNRYLKEQNTPKASAPTASHTYGHVLWHAIGAIARANALTHHNDNRPIPVDVTERGANRISHPINEALRHRLSGAHRAGYNHSIERAAGQAAAYRRLGRAASHVAMGGGHTYNSRSDTRVGTINVHTAATDARGIAADIEPHLRRGQAAGVADYGLA